MDREYYKYLNEREAKIKRSKKIQGLIKAMKESQEYQNSKEKQSVFNKSNKSFRSKTRDRKKANRSDFGTSSALGIHRKLGKILSRDPRRDIKKLETRMSAKLISTANTKSFIPPIRNLYSDSIAFQLSRLKSSDNHTRAQNKSLFIISDSASMNPLSPQNRKRKKLKEPKLELKVQETDLEQKTTNTLKTINKISERVFCNRQVITSSQVDLTQTKQILEKILDNLHKYQNEKVDYVDIDSYMTNRKDELMTLLNLFLTLNDKAQISENLQQDYLNSKMSTSVFKKKAYNEFFNNLETPLDLIFNTFLSFFGKFEKLVSMMHREIKNKKDSIYSKYIQSDKSFLQYYNQVLIYLYKLYKLSDYGKRTDFLDEETNQLKENFKDLRNYLKISMDIEKGANYLEVVDDLEEEFQAYVKSLEDKYLDNKILKNKNQNLRVINERLSNLIQDNHTNVIEGINREMAKKKKDYEIRKTFEEEDRLELLKNFKDLEREHAKLKKRFNRILAKNQILEELKEQKMKETETKSVQVYDLRLSNANPQNPSLSDLKLYQAIEKDILMENLNHKFDEEALHSMFNIFLTESFQKLEKDPQRSSRLLFLEFLVKYFCEKHTSELILEEVLISLKNKSDHSSRTSLFKKLIIGEHDEKKNIKNSSQYRSKDRIKNYIFEYDGLRIFRSFYLIICKRHSKILNEGSFLPNQFSEGALIDKSDCSIALDLLFKELFGEGDTYTLPIEQILNNAMDTTYLLEKHMLLQKAEAQKKQREMKMKQQNGRVTPMINLEEAEKIECPEVGGRIFIDCLFESAIEIIASLKASYLLKIRNKFLMCFSTTRANPFYPDLKEFVIQTLADPLNPNSQFFTNLSSDQILELQLVLLPTIMLRLTNTDKRVPHSIDLAFYKLVPDLLKAEKYIFDYKNRRRNLRRKRSSILRKAGNPLIHAVGAVLSNANASKIEIQKFDSVSLGRLIHYFYLKFERSFGFFKDKDQDVFKNLDYAVKFLGFYDRKYLNSLDLIEETYQDPKGTYFKFYQGWEAIRDLVIKIYSARRFGGGNRL